jgi:small conductance mechanosensitive channel
MNRSLCFFSVLLLTLALVLGNGAAAQDAPRTTAAEQAGALVKVLSDEAARKALVKELERIAEDGAKPGTPPAGATSQQSNEQSRPQESFGRRLAVVTQETAESIMGALKQLSARITAVPDSFAGEDGAKKFKVLIDALKDLALVIIVTYAAFLVFRMFARRIYRRLGQTASEAGPARTALLITGSTIIDAAIVVAAWAAGYVIALTFFGEFGRIGIRQTLYLNAFLFVELFMVAVRFVLSPATVDLRLIPLSDTAAQYLNRWLTIIITIIGYEHLLIIPIVNQNVSYLAGHAVSVIFAMVVLLITLVLVLRNAQAVADWLTDRKDQADRNRFLDFLARRWHWPVLVYIATLFMIVAVRSGGMLIPLLGASAKIVVAIVIGMILTNAISRLISRGVSLPDNVSSRLPLLEPRLNRFVPKMLMIVRISIFLAVSAFAADVIGLIDFKGWLQSRVGVEMTATIVSTMMIVVGGFAAWLALTSWIDYRLNQEYGHVPTARESTLLVLLRNAATIAILVITFMFALSEMGIDIAPLLASAGVLGLAVGFGAQKLVQDIITGIFIQFESAINVGDVITVSGTTGTVERLTIRSASLRDPHGAYHIIPFSSVNMVTNYMRDYSYFVCDMGVAYREDTDEVRDAMLHAYEKLAEDAEIAADFLGPMEWMGVVSFGDNAVVVRTRLKTNPGKQWAIGRAYHAVVKKVFDERSIEMPFPHRTIYFGEDKLGNAPPARFSVDHDPSRSHEGPTTNPA